MAKSKIEHDLASDNGVALRVSRMGLSVKTERMVRKQLAAYLRNEERRRIAHKTKFPDDPARAPYGYKRDGTPRKQSGVWCPLAPEEAKRRARAVQQAHYAANRERLLKRGREYRLKHLERCLERNRQYNRMKYLQESAEVRRERQRAYYKKYPERVKLTVRWRRGRLKICTPVWIKFADLTPFYKAAMWLTAKTGVKYVVDHIVPIKNKMVCGLHVPINLCIMSRSANARKHNKLMPCIALAPTAANGLLQP